MKKSLYFIATAALALGMTACTDEIINPEEIIRGGEEIEVSEPLVKSAADLAGTNWQFSIDDTIVIATMIDYRFGGEGEFYIDEDNIDMSNSISIPINMQFQLTFDEESARLQFPEDMMMLTMVQDGDNYGIEEVNGMNFAYTYDATITTGTLTAVDYDITGEQVELEMNFVYDVATDAIVIDVPIATDMEGNVQNMQLVFQRN